MNVVFSDLGLKSQEEEVMRKKVLLKLSGKARATGMALLGAFLVGSTVQTAFAVGNITDRFYVYNSTGGLWWQTPPEEKWDYTSCYVYHKGNIPAYFSVYSDTANFTYGADSYYIGVGRQYYIPNLVKESGKNNCYLLIKPANRNPATIYGYWSPDSI